MKASSLEPSPVANCLMLRFIPSNMPSLFSASPRVSVRVMSGTAFQCLHVSVACSVALSSDSFFVLAMPLDCISDLGGGSVERDAHPTAKSVIVEMIAIFLNIVVSPFPVYWRLDARW